MSSLMTFTLSSSSNLKDLCYTLERSKFAIGVNEGHLMLGVVVVETVVVPLVIEQI